MPSSYIYDVIDLETDESYFNLRAKDIFEMCGRSPAGMHGFDDVGTDHVIYNKRWFVKRRMPKGEKRVDACIFNSEWFINFAMEWRRMQRMFGVATGK